MKHLLSVIFITICLETLYIDTNNNNNNKYDRHIKVNQYYSNK